MQSLSCSRIENLIIDTLRSMACEPDDVDLGASLEALDIDSLDLIELAQVVEELRVLALAVPATELRGVTTVGDVVDRYLAAAA